MTRKTESPANTRLDGLSDQAIRHVLATANALELGRIDDAERHLVGAMTVAPDHPEVLRLLAGTQHLRGRLHDATTTMRRAVTQRPDDALYHNTLGAILGEDSNFDAAIQSLRRACELEPKLASAWYNLGLLLMRSVRPAEAAAALQQAVELAPDHAGARALLGDMLRASGRIEDASKEYRRVIKQRPYAGTAWWGLADLKTRKLGASDIEQMRRAMQMPGVGDDDQIALGFALAKALDDEGRYRESLETLAKANAIARNRSRWNATKFSTDLDAILGAFSPAPAGAPSGIGEEVIFIASMPRSGSTLIEQILASHSQVEGAGELTDLPQVLSDESRRRRQAFPHWVPAMKPADWQRLGEDYLERTAHWRERRPRFTDKLPNNWQYVGAAIAMLPNARVILCRRDPLETCLSCYRQFLAQNEYTRTFSDLAAYWRDFDRATKHWQLSYPQHVYENVYEELVANPEQKIRAALHFCGLRFEPTCLDFHQTERNVHSPSATQVRQPLRSDTARSARYGTLLDPLRIALGYPALAATLEPFPQRSPPPLPSADQLYADFSSHLERGDGPGAVASLLQRVAELARSAEDWEGITEKLIQQGLPFPATRLLDEALRRFPDAVQLRYLRGNARRLENREKDAEQDFREVLRVQPEHRQAALSLAYMLREQGRNEAAAAVIHASWLACDHDAREVLGLLTFLRECSAYQVAYKIVRDARQRWPDNADIAAVNGELALALGNFTQAHTELRFALDRNPDKGQSWLRLAQCQRYSALDDDDISRMQSVWIHGTLRPVTRICIGFALGKAYDDLEEFAKAADLLRKANAMAKDMAAWHEGDWKTLLGLQLRTSWSQSLLADPTFKPVFVVGMPRTGTTLLTGLLARSSQIRDRGELNWIGAAYSSLRQQNKLEDRSALTSAAAFITAQMRRDDAPARYYLDKNPLNFRYLGFIKSLFPTAKIIHCRRSTKDTAVSIWGHHFAHKDLSFAYDFSSIAAVTDMHDKLMSHWRSSLASPIFEVEYESLVTQSNLETRRIAEFLDIDPAQLFETSASSSALSTASVWQARQPLYTRSIGRWRNYAQYLPELLAAFHGTDSDGRAE